MNGIRIIEEQTTEPITVAQAAANLHVSATLEAATLTRLIKAARSRCEEYTGLSLIVRTVELGLRSFYGGDVPSCVPPRIVLYYGPVGPIASITYNDGDNAAQTLAADQYRVDRYTDTPAIVPAYGVTWPSTVYEFDSVRVRYDAGFSNDDSPPNPVPYDIVQAMHLYIGHYFENREATGSIQIGELPLGALHLLDSHRTGLGV